MGRGRREKERGRRRPFLWEEGGFPPFFAISLRGKTECGGGGGARLGMMREKDDCREEKKMGFIYLGSLPLLRSHNHNGEGKYRKEIPSSICSPRSNAGNRKRKKEREKKEKC